MRPLLALRLSFPRCSRSLETSDQNKLHTGDTAAACCYVLIPTLPRPGLPSPGVVTVAPTPMLLLVVRVLLVLLRVVLAVAPTIPWP